MFKISADAIILPTTGGAAGLAHSVL